MKQFLLFSFFIFNTNCVYSQQTILHIVSLQENAVGAHIYINNKLRTVANIDGIAWCLLRQQDTLRVEYIGCKNYEAQIVEAQNDTLLIDLSPTTYKIDHVVISAVNDNELFKRLVSPKVGVKGIAFGVSIRAADTIYRRKKLACIIKSQSNASFFVSNNIKYRYIYRKDKLNSWLSKDQGRTFTAYQDADSSLCKNRWREDWLFGKIGRPAFLTYKLLKLRDTKLYYRGQQDSVHVFAFFYRGAKFDDSEYINGIIKIDATTRIPISAEFNFYSDNPQAFLYQYEVTYDMIAKNRIYPVSSKSHILFRDPKTMEISHEILGYGEAVDISTAQKP